MKLHLAALAAFCGAGCLNMSLCLAGDAEQPSAKSAARSKATIKTVSCLRHRRRDCGCRVQQCCPQTCGVVAGPACGCAGRRRREPVRHSGRSGQLRHGRRRDDGWRRGLWRRTGNGLRLWRRHVWKRIPVGRHDGRRWRRRRPLPLSLLHLPRAVVLPRTGGVQPRNGSRLVTARRRRTAYDKPGGLESGPSR